jgi:hypothetical protein
VLTVTMVQFFVGGELVKSHPRKVPGKQADSAARWLCGIGAWLSS